MINVLVLIMSLDKVPSLLPHPPYHSEHTDSLSAGGSVINVIVIRILLFVEVLIAPASSQLYLVFYRVN
jgi:hypothetical protein